VTALKKTKEESSLCAKCGACSTVCPVYGITGRESHTARGKQHILNRPAIFARTAAFDDLLSKCLLCGACRDACSRDLDTPGLVVLARGERSRFSGVSFLKYLAGKSLTNPSLLSGLTTMGAAVNQLLASRLPAESGIRLRLTALFREIPPLPEISFLDSLGDDPSKQPLKTRTATAVCTYFTGCLANYLKPEIGAAVNTLVSSTAGCPPEIPRDQTCCGLAALGVGNLKEARRLAKKNITTFEGDSLPILTSCASCYSHLLTYPELLADEPEWHHRAKDFAGRLREFSSYFNSIFSKRPHDFSPSPKEQRVFYHDPCHLRFQTKITAPPRELLALLPGLIQVELANGPQCCGQGGLFSLAHPELSELIGNRLLAEISKLQAGKVVTSCSGCLLQLERGLGARDDGSRVLHLAVLLREYI